MSSRKRKLSVDVTSLLDDGLLGEIIRLVGDKSYRYVAGTCRRFKKVYREVFDSCTTSAKEMIQTVAGAELFFNDTRGRRSTYWLQDTTDLFFYRRLSPLEFVRDTAAKAGELEVLQWAVARGCALNDVYTFTYAAFSGNLLLLQWLLDNGCPWNSRACGAAAKNGHLNALQWLRAHECPWDSRTCVCAARGGHLAVVQWLRANGCFWDSDTCSYAARGGHLAVLQWARSNGCPWNTYTCSAAAGNGHLTVLQWARSNGCPWGAATWMAAAGSGHSEILRWCRANGCPEDPDYPFDES